MSLPFGHGTRSYKNLEEVGSTYVWLYPFVILDKIHTSGALMSEYLLLGDISEPCSLDASPDELRDKFQELERISREFVIRLQKDPRIISVKNIRREPMYHLLNENLIGYAISAVVSPKWEPIKVC